MHPAKIGALTANSALLAFTALRFIPAFTNIAGLFYISMALTFMLAAATLAVNIYATIAAFTRSRFTNTGHNQVISIAGIVTNVLLIASLSLFFVPSVIAHAPLLFANAAFSFLLARGVLTEIALFDDKPEQQGQLDHRDPIKTGALLGLSALAVVISLLLTPGITQFGGLFYTGLGLSLLLAAGAMAAVCYALSKVFGDAHPNVQTDKNKLLSAAGLVTSALLITSLCLFFVPAMLSQATLLYTNLAFSLLMVAGLITEVALFDDGTQPTNAYQQVNTNAPRPPQPPADQPAPQFRPAPRGQAQPEPHSDEAELDTLPAVTPSVALPAYSAQTVQQLPATSTGAPEDPPPYTPHPTEP